MRAIPIETNAADFAKRVQDLGLDVFDKMFRAVELVQERSNRACEALRQANVPYAVVEGNVIGCMGRNDR